MAPSLWDAVAVEDVWERYFAAARPAAPERHLRRPGASRPGEGLRHRVPRAGASGSAPSAAEASPRRRGGRGVDGGAAQAGRRALPGRRRSWPLPRARRAGRRWRPTPTRRSDVGRDFDRAVAALRAAGYETVTVFGGRARAPGAAWLSESRVGIGARRARLLGGRARSSWAAWRSRASAGSPATRTATSSPTRSIDAMLGAAGPRRHRRALPVRASPQWRARRSLDLLRRLRARARRRLASSCNADCVLVGERAAHRAACATRCGRALAGAMGVEPDRVTVRGDDDATASASPAAARASRPRRWRCSCSRRRRRYAATRGQRHGRAVRRSDEPVALERADGVGSIAARPGPATERRVARARWRNEPSKRPCLRSGS